MKPAEVLIIGQKFDKESQEPKNQKPRTNLHFGLDDHSMDFTFQHRFSSW